MNHRSGETQSPWPLRVVALLIAILIWMFASYLPRLESLTEKEITASLSYAATPTGMIADPDRLSEVIVRVRGTEDDIGPIGSDSVRVTVPLPEVIEPGVATEVQLSSADVVAPDGVEILSFSPPSVFVVIDKVAEIQVRVLPDFRGQPGAGLTRDDIRWEAKPREVLISGPRAALANLTRVTTVPINVGGRALDFSEQVAVQLRDPALSATPNFVTIEVKLEADTPSNGPSSADDGGNSVNGSDQP